MPPNESQCLPELNERVCPYEEEAEFRRKLHIWVAQEMDWLLNIRENPRHSFSML